MKIAFINPPHADWSLANNMTFFMMKSYYNSFGKYSDQIEWIEPPYKYLSYTSINDLIDEVIEGDVILFSSYIWNYTIVDEVSERIKNEYPEKILVLGGPHIGTNEKELLDQRPFYDFICQPTKPGETFIEDFIDCYIEDRLEPKNISWELRNPTGRIHDISKENYSVYEDNFEYLSKTCLYAKENGMEPFIILESTRGCPYKCVYCEWGGGIGTKIYKKDLDLVKRDILALKKAGYNEAYLTDANFGAFEDRDMELFGYAWENDLNLTDISTVKAKDLNRRKRLIDKWFEIIKSKNVSMKANNSSHWEHDGVYVSVLPTVSIQSVSDKAMEVCDRVDLTSKEKIELSKHISRRSQELNLPPPPVELILAMPGSTIKDFYEEMNLIWDFKSWNSFRYDYMFLPDSKLNSEEYKEKYNIKTVEVYTDLVDEDGVDNWNGIYAKSSSNFKTILSCFSFTEEELHEMWFMNQAGNYLLEQFYSNFKSIVEPSEFCKKSFEVLSKIDGFDEIYEEIKDILNPNTPPKSLKRIQGKYRQEAIREFIDKNELLYKSEISIKILL